MGLKAGTGTLLNKVNLAKKLTQLVYLTSLQVALSIKLQLKNIKLKKNIKYKNLFYSKKSEFLNEKKEQSLFHFL